MSRTWIDEELIVDDPAEVREQEWLDSKIAILRRRPAWEPKRYVYLKHRGEVVVSGTEGWLKGLH
jgi:hypothetical protein